MGITTVSQALTVGAQSGSRISNPKMKRLFFMLVPFQVGRGSVTTNFQLLMLSPKMLKPQSPISGGGGVLS